MPLATKIAAASKNVGGKLNPDKMNKEQKYDYISADKILATCGQALAEAGVVVYPSISKYEIQAIDRGSGKGPRYDAFVNLDITIADGETEFKAAWLGVGSDYSVPDKAVYKAMTSGHKYFLMKLLNIGAGNEDGEHENGDDAPVTGKSVIVRPKTATEQAKNGNGYSEEPPPWAEDDAAFASMPSAGQERAAAQAAADDYIPACPKCSGDVWDNRTSKRNPRAPDFKCKNPDCGGAIWLPETIEKGRAAMFANVKKIHGEDVAPFKAWLKEKYGVDSSKALSITQLAEVVARLKDLAEATERQQAAA